MPGHDRAILRVVTPASDDTHRIPSPLPYRRADGGPTVRSLPAIRLASAGTVRPQYRAAMRRPRADHERRASPPAAQRAGMALRGVAGLNRPRAGNSPPRERDRHGCDRDEGRVRTACRGSAPARVGPIGRVQKRRAVERGCACRRMMGCGRRDRPSSTAGKGDRRACAPRRRVERLSACVCRATAARRSEVLGWRVCQDRPGKESPQWDHLRSSRGCGMSISVRAGRRSPSPASLATRRTDGPASAHASR